MRDRIVVVTGGASGIGRATVLRCAAEGARVAVLDLDEPGAERVGGEAAAAGAPEAVGLRCDVAREDAVAAAFAEIRRRLGTPNGVFANAGIEVQAPAHEMSYQTWRRVLAVNLDGTFLTCKHALGAMLADEVAGSIVCTSSPNAFTGYSGGGNACYAASKGGISALVRSLAVDYAQAGIRVNAVVPGATDTPLMWSAYDEDYRDEARHDIEARARQTVPAGRLGTPAEIAWAVTWLLSDEASYVTGSQLFCDGGLTIKSVHTF